MMDDAEQLRRYVEEKSEAAFAELVRRHLDLVYSTALRQLAGDTHLAQDVTQSVFTALARKASALTDHASLAGWLYLGAHHAAAQAVRGEQRRRVRESEAHTMQQLNTSDPAADWERVRPALDDAMRELNEPDREAVLLRYFERRPFAEIGAALHLSEDAARMRVERALAKLHILLSRRGITSTAGALGTVLAHQAVAAAPTGLAAGIVGMALTEAVDAGAFAGVLAFMTATKTTITLGIAAVLTTVATFYEMQSARAAGASLDADRSALAVLRSELAALSAATQAEETALAETKAVAAREAATKAAAQAVALEKQRADQALQQFLKSDPQLQQLKRDRDLQTGIRWHLPLGLGLKLTPDELEQFATEWERRYALKLPIDTATLEGIPARLASDARFIEAWKVWDTRLVVENFNMNLGEPLNAAQADRLIRSIQSARPNPIPPEGWDFYGIQQTADWERVVAEAGDYLSPSQMTALRGFAAASRTKALLSIAAKQANK